jgi:hypothetical protein
LLVDVYGTLLSIAPTENSFHDETYPRSDWINIHGYSVLSLKRTWRILRVRMSVTRMRRGAGVGNLLIRAQGLDPVSTMEPSSDWPVGVRESRYMHSPR